MKGWLILSSVRRAQTIDSLRVRFKGGFFFASAFLFSFLMYFNTPFYNKSRSLLLDATGLMSSICHWPAQAGSSLTASLISHFEVHKHNKRLRDENHILRAQHYRFLALTAENKRLREKLKIVGEGARDFLSVRVRGGSNSPYQHNLLLEGGKRAGIQVKSAVFVDNQILGRVIEISDYSCRVLLITDPQSHIPVVLEKSGVQGILSGDNSPLMKIKIVEKTLLPLTDTLSLSSKAEVQRSKIEKGEYVFSSGQGGIFPPGFVVGQIIDVTPHEILVQSTIDEARMEYVQISKPYEEPVYE